MQLVHDALQSFVGPGLCCRGSIMIRRSASWFAQLGNAGRTGASVGRHARQSMHEMV